VVDILNIRLRTKHNTIHQVYRIIEEN